MSDAAEATESNDDFGRNNASRHVHRTPHSATSIVGNRSMAVDCDGLHSASVGARCAEGMSVFAEHFPEKSFRFKPFGLKMGQKPLIFPTKNHWKVETKDNSEKCNKNFVCFLSLVLELKGTLSLITFCGFQHLSSKRQKI